MKLVAILRAKDNIQTIGLCLQRLSDLTDGIIVADNDSTDGTLEIYKRFPKIKKVLHTKGYHEGRDKILLLDEAKKENPDWILVIDHDEVFEKHLTRNIMENYMKSHYDHIVFRLCNYWLDDIHCRIDRYWFLYSFRPQRQMWRNVPSAHFPNNHIHCGWILGIGQKRYISPYRLKHYGYSDPKQVKDKFDFYRKEEPDYKNKFEHLDPSIKAITYKYREFDNRFINTVWIYLFSWIASILAWIVEFKRKHVKGVRFFSKYHG
ncbi:MAG: glycosyltransferase [Parcubacteria group bacterium]